MASATYTFELYDRQGNILADITPLAKEKHGVYRLNRPTTWSFNLSCDQPEVYTVHTDGHPFLGSLRRTLKVWRTPRVGGSPSLVFYGFVWTVTRTGVEDGAAQAAVTCVDPMIWWNYRPLRDSGGTFSTPNFTTPISGGRWIKEGVENSVTYDGTLGVDTTLGSFDVTVPPAWDLAATLVNTPIMMGDFFGTLMQTGGVDAWIAPDDTLGLEGGLDMFGKLNAVNRRGTDRVAHFDYATGDYSISKIIHTDDASTIANTLRMYLGPKQDDDHWQGLIAADDPNLPDPPQTALLATRAQSQTDFGNFYEIEIFDDNDNDNAARQMYLRLWQQIFLLRSLPKELLQVTPHTDAPYEPFVDYDLGDTFQANSGGNALGFDLSGAVQRVYGFDVMPDDSGTEKMGELIASPRDT